MVTGPPAGTEPLLLGGAFVDYLGALLAEYLVCDRIGIGGGQPMQAVTQRRLCEGPVVFADIVDLES